MTQLYAFTKKEFTEIIRTGKVYILLIIFFFFGVQNPAIAKLTPWLYKMLSGTLEEQGISIGNITVTAMTSWEQYYKNIFMGFIVFIIMFFGILTTEYQKGTLVNILTKGMPRWKVIAAKSIALIISWSVCYWFSFGITYGYTAYYWDNSIVSHIGFAAFSSYLFGIWLISLVMLFSSFLSSGTSVLLSTGIVYIAVNLLSMIPDISGYLPTKLTSGLSLLSGSESLSDFYPVVAITAALILSAWIISAAVFNRKKL